MILAVPLPASSQQRGKDAVGNRVLRCASIEDERIRLACFDDIAHSVALEESGRVAAPAAASTAQPCASDKDGCDARPAMPNGVVAGSAAAAHDADGLDAYSDKQVLNVSIIKARKDAVGRWLFYLDNGQVWRQLEKRFVTVPKDLPVEASISPGVLNSNNLRVGENGRTIKVKRLK